MSKVLFINPVVREEDNPRHVPYGMATLAAIVMKKGHQVQVFDQNAWRKPPEVLESILKADQWDVIALGSISSAYKSVKEIIQQARKSCPDSLIILGGGILTSIPQDIMNLLPQIDIGVVGEAYQTFPEILEMMDAGKREWAQIHGTISRKEDGDLILSPQRALIENLDILPYPAVSLFPIEEIYFPNSQALWSEEGMLAQRRLDINGSLGCSMICRYCYHLGITGDMRYENDAEGNLVVAFDKPGNYSRTIRYHSPEYIVNMAKFYYDTYDIDFVAFLDENLMTMDQYSKRTWMAGICKLWIEAGLQPTCIRDGVPHDENCRGVHWSGTSHATLCTREVLKTMRSAGCSHLVYGYESFSRQVMKTIGKGATPKTNIRSFFWTLEAGIRPIPNQIIGFPIEDFQSIYDNMDTWKKYGIMVKPFFATPYPGSEWYREYRDAILAQYDNDLEKFLLDLGDATRVTAVISHNFNSVELLGLRELMINLDYKRIHEYEDYWRKAHNVPYGQPSTLFPKKAWETA